MSSTHFLTLWSCVLFIAVYELAFTKAQTIQDPDAAQECYEAVRSDSDPMEWCFLTYDMKTVVQGGTGTGYGNLLAKFTMSARIYAYVRFETGDEMSRRAKFAFITWIGPDVGPLKKAAVSKDKAFVKRIWHVFTKEILADDLGDVAYNKVLTTLNMAAGAQYGTGK